MNFIFHESGANLHLQAEFAKLEPKARREGWPCKIDHDRLCADVTEHPDAYIHERARCFGAHPKSMWGALRKIKASYKKNGAPSQGGQKRSVIFPGEDRGV